MVRWAKSEGERLAEGPGMPHIQSCPLGLCVPEDTRGPGQRQAKPYSGLRDTSPVSEDGGDRGSSAGGTREDCRKQP